MTRRLVTDAPPAALTAAAVTITPRYSDAVPRELLGVELRCSSCGAVWDATPSRGGAYTGSGLDRQARIHTCPPRTEGQPRP